MSEQSALFEVEKIDPDRWNRIEDAVFDRLDGEAEPARPFVPAARHARWPIAAAFAAGGVAALIGAFLAPPLHRPEAPRFPSHIMTGDDGSRVALGDSSLEIGRQSELVVSGDDAHGVVVVLDHGEVTCEVAARRDRPAFVVQTGAVRFTLTDGEARVRRADDGTTDVFVERGVIGVRNGNADFQLHRGESWNNLPPIEAVAPALTTVPATPPRPAVVRPAAPHPIENTPVATVEDAPARLAPSLRERYEAAARLEESDPDAALARYDEIAKGDDRWAATALYAEGRLAYERGDFARSKRALESYGARFPNGSNAHDAQALLSQIAKAPHR
jgi:hypothetical protein